MFCWPYFDLFDDSCTWVLLCIFNRYKFTSFCAPAFFYSFCHILNLEVNTMRWPTDSATVHLGVVCHSPLSGCQVFTLYVLHDSKRSIRQQCCSISLPLLQPPCHLWNIPKRFDFLLTASTCNLMHGLHVHPSVGQFCLHSKNHS